MKVRALSRAHPAAGGVPWIDRVDLDIFRRTYFTHCLRCGFCADACCQYGTEVDTAGIDRILAHANGLENFTQTTRDTWFGELRADADFPDGSYRRTAVSGDRCVFHSRSGRGCQLHAYAIVSEIEPHTLKPMLCAIFPLTYNKGLLHPAEEVQVDELICLGAGETVYRGVRAELEHYFGTTLVGELDALERSA